MATFFGVMLASFPLRASVRVTPVGQLDGIGRSHPSEGGRHRRRNSAPQVPIAASQPHHDPCGWDYVVELAAMRAPETTKSRRGVIHGGFLLLPKGA